MKLRLDKNSIRLRVKKSDLEILREKSSVQQTIAFPNHTFHYVLSVSENEKTVMATMNEQTIEVIIPTAEAAAWMSNDETGIYYTLAFGSNQSLDIIIEKDFPCKDKSTIENADTFVELAEKNQFNEC